MQCFARRRATQRWLSQFAAPSVTAIRRTLPSAPPPDAHRPPNIRESIGVRFMELLARGNVGPPSATQLCMPRRQWSSTRTLAGRRPSKDARRTVVAPEDAPQETAVKGRVKGNVGASGRRESGFSSPHGDPLRDADIDEGEDGEDAAPWLATDEEGLVSSAEMEVDLQRGALCVEKDAVDEEPNSEDVEEDERDGDDLYGSSAGEATSGEPSPQSKLLVENSPLLAAEYDPDANEIPVDEVLLDSAAIAKWRCSKCEHTWASGVFVRSVLKTGCPVCTAKRQPTLAAVRSDLVHLWDRNLNDPFVSPNEISSTSAKSVYWRCPACSQGFAARVKDRVQGKAKCPYCATATVSTAHIHAKENSIIQQEWHPLKNGDLQLDQLQPADHKTRAWWLCSLCGHDWEASLATRLSKRRQVKGKHCPVCHGQAVA